MNTSLRPIFFAATVAALLAACGQAKQTESDSQRLNAMWLDGSVSTSDAERAQSELRLPRCRRLPRPHRRTGGTQSLYSGGETDLPPLLDAQHTRLAVRIDSNASKPQPLLDSIQLYQALGGGWQVFEPNKESFS